MSAYSMPNLGNFVEDVFFTGPDLSIPEGLQIFFDENEGYCFLFVCLFLVKLGTL